MDGLNSPEPDRDANPDSRPLLPKVTRSRAHLSIWSLMLITTVCCLMAAAGNQLLKAIRSDNLPRSKFVLFTLTAPVIALIVISVIRALYRAIATRRAAGAISCCQIAGFATSLNSRGPVAATDHRDGLA